MRASRAILAECRFNQPVRLIGRQKYFRGIVHSKRREIHEIEVLVRKRKVNFANPVEVVENRFSHRVERVLERVAIVLRKRLQHRLAHAVPDRTEFDFASFVKPVRMDHRR